MLTVLLVLGIASPMLAEETSFSRIVSFGDSLTDTGNQRPSNPNYLKSHFSNGIIWIEYLADKLGLARPVPSEKGGMNFCEGGARTTRILQQVKRYLQAHTPKPDELFTVNGGGNDALNLKTRWLNYGAEAGVAGNLLNSVKMLAKAGAQTIMVHSVARLGMTPCTKIMPVPKLAIDSDKWARKVNRILRKGLAKIEAGNPSITIIWVDVYQTMTDIKANPKAYGLVNITQACFFGSPFSKAGTIRGNPQHYLFWDLIHPTTKGHSLIAEAAYRALLSRTALPEKFAQMFHNFVRWLSDVPQRFACRKIFARPVN